MPQFKDLTGKTIGRLTFLEHEVIGVKRFWKIKCQCGNEQTYRADYFTTMEKKGVKFECCKCKLERKSPTLTDKVFGRLTVLKEVPGKDHHRWWLCRCECGEEKEIPSVRLSGNSKKAKTKSCGCLARKLHSKWANTTQYPPAHKLRTKFTEERKASLYHSRNALLSSCYNKKDVRYKNHGSLGHKVCDLWRNGAKDFVNWAINMGYKKGDGIYLKDGEYIFCKENCYIIQKSQYSKLNNSKFIEWNGKRQSISDWAREIGCKIPTLSSRLKRFSKYGLDKAMNLDWIPKRNYRKFTSFS